MDSIQFKYTFLMVILAIHGKEETPNIENIKINITFELHLNEVTKITKTTTEGSTTTEGKNTQIEGFTTSSVATTALTDQTTTLSETKSTQNEGFTTSSVATTTSIEQTSTSIEEMTTSPEWMTTSTEGMTTSSEGMTTWIEGMPTSSEGMTTSTERMTISSEGMTTSTERMTISFKGKSKSRENILKPKDKPLDSSTVPKTLLPKVAEFKRYANVNSAIHPTIAFDGLPPKVCQEVEIWLISVFNDTVGFDSLIMKNSTTAAKVDYEVVFNVLALSESGALCTDDDHCLTQDLTTKTNLIIDHKEDFSGYYVDRDPTNSSMVGAINTFSDNYLVDPCGKLQNGVCSNLNNTCYSENGAIVCRDKCFVYERDVNPECTNPSSSLSTIFISGTCTMKDGNAECNCGMSPGDVMPNLYDGTRCVNSAFIVGMAAGFGGIIILGLLGAAITFGLKWWKLQKQKDITEVYKEVTQEPRSTVLSTDVPKETKQAEFSNAAFDNSYESVSQGKEYANTYAALSNEKQQANDGSYEALCPRQQNVNDGDHSYYNCK